MRSSEGLDRLSGSVVRFDQLIRETSGADQWNPFKTDFIGPLRWFPVATDLIVGLSRKVDRDPDLPLDTVMRLGRISYTICDFSGQHP